MAKMENERKEETNFITKKQFSKIHARIQKKYSEMQQKLEKSKSIDMLTSLSENFIYANERRCNSINDIKNLSDQTISLPVNEKNLQTRTMVIENMQKTDVVCKNIIFNEAIVTGNESLVNQEEKGLSEIEDNISETFFLGDMSYLSKASLESLTEGERESDESLPPPTPTSKTLRDKIGSKISAAKEKRNALRERKRELREENEELILDTLDHFILSNTLEHDPEKVFKKTKTATVTIGLIEAFGFAKETSDEKWRYPYCRFRLGTEKRKSKTVKSNASTTKWQEYIYMNMYEDTLLEISLWDKDVFVGKCTVDMSELQKEKTHRIRRKLEGEDPNIEIFFLLTISGISFTDTMIDLEDHQKIQRRMETERKKFAWYRLWDKFSEVGWLSVTVYGAKGLSASDCLCVLQLDNERLYTHTEYKTHAPNWMKIFAFAVTDITSVLEVTIWDERRSEEVGNVSIPLLNIKGTVKKWYALKGITQRERAKGNNPRILLEMGITWNLVKASVRVINPKEVDLLQTTKKLDRHIFTRNISRAKAILSSILEILQIFRTCFEWDSMHHNLIALVVWLLFCWFFKIWMLPLLLLIPFALYKPTRNPVMTLKRRLQPNVVESKECSKIEKEEKHLTLRQKLNSLQEMVQTVQNVMGKFATVGESIKNLFNFSVPYLSYLAIFFILLIAFAMYLIPLRYILMGWSIHKFTRKILRPNRIPNSEIMDLLSRVPDDDALQSYEEYPIENLSEEDENL